MTTRVWPGFLGIGAIKSGTTWLWGCLREHSQVFMPAMKEIEFFDARYGQGIDWYLSFFEDAGSRVCGEISPQYMHCPEAVERMRPLWGRTKLLVCLRDPITRAYSHFMMDAREWSGVSREEKARRFEEVALDSKYVKFGCYADQLEPYVRRFGKSNLHAILFEDIARRPEDVIAGVCRFLGVDEAFRPSSLRKRVNASKRYRSVRLFRAFRTSVRLSDRFGLGDLVLALKRSGLRDRVISILEVPQGYLPMSRGSEDRLSQFYAQHNERLEALLGCGIPQWSRPERLLWG